MEVERKSGGYVLKVIVMSQLLGIEQLETGDVLIVPEERNLRSEFNKIDKKSITSLIYTFERSHLYCSYRQTQ